MKIKKIEVCKLVEDPANVRRHSDKNIEAIKASLLKFGQQKPIVINDKGIVVAGNGTLAAAKMLDWKKIDCVETDLETIEQTAFAIADNRTTDLSEWDKDALAGQLLSLEEDGWDVIDVGFDKEEDIDFFDEKPISGKTEDDEVPEVETNEFGVKRGQIWQLGDHRLMCGDSTSAEDVERLMDGNKVDMVFTDPPYGIDVVQSSQVGGSGPTKFGKVGGGNIVKSKTYSKIVGDETTDTARKFYDTCVKIGFKNIVMWGGNYFTDFLKPSRCWIIWDKGMTGNFSQAEMAWTDFEVGGIKVFNFLWNGMSREGNRKDELKGRVHPTQKPVGLFYQIFEKLDHKTIFDGFLGSGSTLIACEKTGRKCYGMEIDVHYCNVIIKRWQDFTGKEAKLYGKDGQA